MPGNTAAADRLAADLHRAGTQAADLEPVTTDVAALLAPLAARYARKRTGNMARRIGAQGARVVAAAPYSMAVHQGFRRRTPNPFLTQAVDAGLDTAADLLTAHATAAFAGLDTRYGA